MVLTDLDRIRLDAGVGHVHGEIAKLASRGRISADAAARLTGLVTGSLTKDAFADADFVIEAVFEEIAVKQQVFAEVEAVVRPDCVLATNTSSLSVTEMAAGLAHPERVVGFHFFNPVAMMPLVEVARRRTAAATDDATLATALAVGKALKKNCVLVKDSPAFVVNRLLTRFLGEIIAAVDEGTPLEVAEHAPDPLGLPIVPVPPAPAGRPGRGSARRRDAARGLPRPVQRVAEAPRPGRGGPDRGLPARLLHG